MAVSIETEMTLPLEKISVRKDASAPKSWLRALEMTVRIEDTPSRIFPVEVEALGARFGEAPALIGSQYSLTHAGLAARANRYSRWALAQNIRKGDTVALLMPNCPDYLAIWLGITRIGGIVALLNTHLTGEALGACRRAAAGPKHIIAGERLADRLVTTTAQVWRHGEGFFTPWWKASSARHSSMRKNLR